MGCDMAAVAEVRRDGVWHAITAPIFAESQPAGPDRMTSRPFHWRSYTMYCVFGVDYGHRGLPAIAAVRGMPADASTEARRRLDSDWGQTWLSVADIEGFDWDRDVGDGVLGPKPLRDLFGDDFWRQVATLASLGAPDDVRVVVAFNN